MSCPRPDDVVIQSIGVLQAFRPAAVVVAGVELLGPFGGGAEVQHGVVSAVAHLHLVEAHLVEQGLPGVAVHIGGDVHHAPVIDDDGGFSGLLGHLAEALLGVQLERQQLFLAFEEERFVIRQEVHAALVEEGGRLGLRIDGEASVGEILGDLGQSGGLTRARAAGEYDVGDFFPHIGLSFQSAKINILSKPLVV